MDMSPWRRWYPVIVLALLWAIVTWVAVTKGEVTFQIYLVIPVMSFRGFWGSLSSLLGIIALFYFIFTAAGIGKEDEWQEGVVEERKSSFGGVIMIGPIPIVLGTDRRMAMMAMALALVVLAILVLLLI